MMNHQMEKKYKADTDWQSLLKRGTKGGGKAQLLQPESRRSEAAAIQDKDGSPLGGDATDEEAKVEAEDDALTDEEHRFLKQFPSWKKKKDKRIRTLYAIADSIDKSHQKATKTKIMANSASAISGVMSLLGLALAPVTAGASLVLTAAGTGLGMVAGVANVVTDMIKNSHNTRALAQANRALPSSDQDLENVGGEKTSYVWNGSTILYKCASAWEVIRKHIRAFEISKTHPHVASAAKKLMTVGQVSTQTSRQVQTAFGGTALAMSKNALRKNGVLAALSLGQDICTIYEDWKDLKAATPTELAKELRERAREQEQVVSERTCRYKRLKKRLSEKKPGRSLKRATGTQPFFEKARPRGHPGAETLGL